MHIVNRVLQKGAGLLDCQHTCILLVRTYNLGQLLIGIEPPVDRAELVWHLKVKVSECFLQW